MKADAKKIVDGVYWVGVLDWDLRDYHGYKLNGTTYNCYLVFGEEKVALIDNVYPGTSAQLWGRVKDAFEQEGRDFKIDVIIQNHIENDHSGSLVEFVKKFPDVDVYCSQMAVAGLKSHLPSLADFDFKTVSTGDSVELGGKTLSFVQAPMLHWPDSMFTLIEEDGILCSNDAFGQHICLSERFDYEVDEAILMASAQKFYANLITPSSGLYLLKMKELGDLDLVSKVKMIAPSHGQIWTEPAQIIGKYNEWATGKCKDKVTLVYDTMHHSTTKMAQAMAEGIMSAGFEVKMYYLHEDDRSDLVTDILDSKAVCIGSPTVMNNPYPSLGDTIYYLTALNFAATTYKKQAVIFGSKGWGGGATNKLETDLTAAGFEIFDKFDTIYIPTEEVYDKCYEIGKSLVESLKED